MIDLELGEMQSKFADMIWEMEPVPSGVLVKLAEERFHWKKPTTYTTIRVLCDKGLFRNENCVVRSEISREEYYLRRSQETIERGFGGSLPTFLTAFASTKKPLSEEEIKSLETLIAEYRGRKGS